MTENTNPEGQQAPDNAAPEQEAFEYVSSLPEEHSFTVLRRGGGIAEEEASKFQNEVRAWMRDQVNTYNRLVAAYYSLQDAYESVDTSENLETVLEDERKRLTKHYETVIHEQRVADDEQYQNALQQVRAAAEERIGELQAELAEAREAASTSAAVFESSSRVNEIVQAVQEETAAHAKQVMERVNAVESNLNAEVNAIKAEAHEEAGRIISNANDEASRVTAHAQAEVAAAVKYRNQKVEETNDLLQRFGMFLDSTRERVVDVAPLQSITTSDALQTLNPSPESTAAVEEPAVEETEEAGDAYTVPSESDVNASDDVDADDEGQQDGPSYAY